MGYGLRRIVTSAVIGWISPHGSGPRTAALSDVRLAVIGWSASRGRGIEPQIVWNSRVSSPSRMFCKSTHEAAMWCPVRRLPGDGRPNDVAARILEGSFYALELAEGYVVVRRYE